MTSASMVWRRCHSDSRSQLKKELPSLSWQYSELLGFRELYEVWDAVAHPTTDVVDNLIITDIINIIGNFAEAVMLLPFRISHDPLLEATWLSARNSVLTSMAGAAVTVICGIFAVQWPQTVIVAFGALLAFQAVFLIASDVKDGRSGG